MTTMEKIKQALEALRNDLHHVPMTDRLASAFRHLDAALSALEGSKAKELTDEEIERLSYMPGLGIAMSGQPYVSEVTDKMADHAAECMRYVRDHGYLSPQPKELGAEPVADFNGWYCAHCKTGVDGSDVTYHEQHTVCGRVITNDVPPKTPTSREKAMEEAGDAMDELLDGPWFVYDENREKAIAAWRTAKHPK